MYTLISEHALSYEEKEEKEFLHRPFAMLLQIHRKLSFYRCFCLDPVPLDMSKKKEQKFSTLHLHKNHPLYSFK